MTITKPIRGLTRTVRVQRRIILGSLVVTCGATLLAAGRSVGDAEFKTVTCKELKLVDEKGAIRIHARTGNGKVGMALLDKSAMPRVIAEVFDDDAARLVICDLKGTARITAATLASGRAALSLQDELKQIRIIATTDTSGNGVLEFHDKEGRPRITTGTLANDTAHVAISDANGVCRINSMSSADGDAGTVWFDPSKSLRIKAITAGDGSVTLPTRDRKEHQ